MPVRPSACQTGFTLIECIVALGILSLLASLTMPAIGSLARSARVSGTLSDLSADLAFARVSAISRNRSYVVCPSQDGKTCSLDGNWSVGWIGFHDPDRNLAPTPGTDPASHRQRRKDTLRISSGTGRPLVRYLPDGQSPGTNLTIHICEEGLEAARVVVNNAGRVRTQKAEVPTACPV